MSAVPQEKIHQSYLHKQICIKRNRPIVQWLCKVNKQCMFPWAIVSLHEYCAHASSPELGRCLLIIYVDVQISWTGEKIPWPLVHKITGRICWATTSRDVIVNKTNSVQNARVIFPENYNICAGHILTIPIQ